MFLCLFFFLYLLRELENSACRPPRETKIRESYAMDHGCGLAASRLAGRPTLKGIVSKRTKVNIKSVSGAQRAKCGNSLMKNESCLSERCRFLMDTVCQAEEELHCLAQQSGDICRLERISPKELRCSFLKVKR